VRLYDKDVHFPHSYYIQMTKKTLQVEEKVWKGVQVMRLKYGFHTVNDTIKALLDVSKTADYELKEYDK